MNAIAPDAKVSAPDRGAAVASLPDRYRLTLADGLPAGSIVYHEVTLRELTAKDLLDAQDESERVVTTGGTVALVSSPARMGVELLRRQIARLTENDATHNGPLSRDELGRLSMRDLTALQQATDALDVLAALRTGEAAQGRGRNPGGDARS